jgi:hypothetical protein
MNKKTILVRTLDQEAQEWHHCEVILEVSPWGWFPSEALCDVRKGKLVGKSEVIGYKATGTMGSGCVGMSLNGLPAAKALLAKAGYIIS